MNFLLNLFLLRGGYRKSHFKPQRTPRKESANALRTLCSLWFKHHKLTADATVFAIPSLRGRITRSLHVKHCRFSYALAKSLGEPLLFEDQDFSQTDLAVAET